MVRATSKAFGCLNPWWRTIKSGAGPIRRNSSKPISPFRRMDFELPRGDSISPSGASDLNRSAL